MGNQVDLNDDKDKEGIEEKMLLVLSVSSSSPLFTSSAQLAATAPMICLLAAAREGVERSFATLVAVCLVGICTGRNLVVCWPHFSFWWYLSC